MKYFCVTCYVVIAVAVAGMEGVVVLKKSPAVTSVLYLLYAPYWVLYWNCTGTVSVTNLAGS